MSGECNVCGLTGCVEDNHAGPDSPRPDEAERGDVGRCEDQFVGLYDRRFWCELRAGHIGAHCEGTTCWTSSISELIRLRAENADLRRAAADELAVLGQEMRLDVGGGHVALSDEAYSEASGIRANFARKDAQIVSLTAQTAKFREERDGFRALAADMVVENEQLRAELADQYERARVEIQALRVYNACWGPDVDQPEAGGRPTSCPGCRTVAPASHAQGCPHAPDGPLDVLRRLVELMDEADHKVLGSQQYQNEWRDIWTEARALLGGAE